MPQQSIIILSNKIWNKDLPKKLSLVFQNKEFILIDDPKKFKSELVKKINPRFIFVPHWSYIIPKDIWNRWDTIIFHMTDLPYGRGGSPLQNLISLGKKNTKISAIQCSEIIDGGGLYLKSNLDLSGSAQEIYFRANDVIKEMIVEFLNKKPSPLPQKGKVTNFRRRTPEESNLNSFKNKSLNDIYNHIRMLDGDGYPKAFLEFGDFQLIFSEAKLNTQKLITKVEIKKIPKKNK